MVDNKELGFYAYASHPPEIGQTIEQAVEALKANTKIDVKTWRTLDIPGHFISQEVLEEIDSCGFLLCNRQGKAHIANKK